LKRSDNRGRGPRVGVCVRIDSDLHHRQRGIAECGVDALPPDGGLEAVGYLQPPKRRDNRPPVDDLIEPRISFRGTLVFKTQLSASDGSRTGSTTPFVDQIPDLSIAESNALAHRTDSLGSRPRRVAIESAPGRHQNVRPPCHAA
jgi:hypothetical protein